VTRVFVVLFVLTSNFVNSVFFKIFAEMLSLLREQVSSAEALFFKDINPIFSPDSAHIEDTWHSSSE
jgi:hypothetical protein